MSTYYKTTESGALNTITISVTVPASFQPVATKTK